MALQCWVWQLEVKTCGKCCDCQRATIEKSGGFGVLAYIGINMPYRLPGPGKTSRSCLLDVLNSIEFSTNVMLLHQYFTNLPNKLFNSWNKDSLGRGIYWNLVVFRCVSFSPGSLHRPSGRTTRPGAASSEATSVLPGLWHLTKRHPWTTRRLPLCYLFTSAHISKLIRNLIL